MTRCTLAFILVVTALIVPIFSAGPSSASLPASSRHIQQPPVPQPGRPPSRWQFTKTDHFDIAYAPELTPQVERMRGQAERAYQQVSSDLQHALSLRPMLVLFSTRGDLERALASGTVPRHHEHILLSLDPPARIEGDFVHELAHVFAFDIVPASARTDFPRWMHEGLAEFERGEWAEEDHAIVREMLRTNRLPRLSDLTVGASAEQARLLKIIGHAAFDFLVSRAGQGSVRQVLLSWRESVDNPTDTYLTAIGLSADDFDRRFGEYLKARFPVQP